MVRSIFRFVAALAGAFCTVVIACKWYVGAPADFSVWVWALSGTTGFTFDQILRVSDGNRDGQDRNGLGSAGLTARPDDSRETPVPNLKSQIT